MTANLREWRHILKLRAAPAAHPSIQQLMKILLKELQKLKFRLFLMIFLMTKKTACLKRLPQNRIKKQPRRRGAHFLVWLFYN